MDKIWRYEVKSITRILKNRLKVELILTKKTHLIDNKLITSIYNIN
jgi:hypothetical protein